LFIAYTNTQA